MNSTTWFEMYQGLRKEESRLRSIKLHKENERAMKVYETDEYEDNIAHQQIRQISFLLSNSRLQADSVKRHVMTEEVYMLDLSSRQRKVLNWRLSGGDVDTAESHLGMSKSDIRKAFWEAIQKIEENVGQFRKAIDEYGLEYDDALLYMKLSQKEREAFLLDKRGLKSREIAEALGISASRVRDIKSSIRQKALVTL
ncbi:sigma factor-like helix-turn-helix DNA-binding protein [Heliorestis convoluta]|uniref:Putative transcriptional regulator, LuxR family n=1 Tax=Heliorestis convoluta TaxID=356322 RepID=A0A5Q2MVV3_9FIRM|nr:sigma factor-like helix-turn-helix DNA-binding protein [Heliorestis convoluta]QGG46338.1 putative transcriptional regulator, LuxR family [Heliorestis convoluta]